MNVLAPSRHITSAADPDTSAYVTGEEAALAMIEEAEAALEVNDFPTALSALEDVHRLTRTSPSLTNRALLAESWAKTATDDLAGAELLLARATEITAWSGFTERDRAEVLFRLGCCRLQSAKVGNATQLLTIALQVCHTSEQDCTKLQSRIHQWRSRCWLQHHLPDMARDDAELAIELAEGLGDQRTLAQAWFQASVVTERQSQWLLARMYGERALDAFEQLGDHVNRYMVLNNLGGINALLGSHDRATACLDLAIQAAQELGNPVGAAYSLSTLAHLRLTVGDPGRADEYALRAQEILEGNDTHLGELGNVLLIRGRAMLAQNDFDVAERCFLQADGAFEQISSIGHRAEAWVAQGDLARCRGDLEAAAGRYRKAAVALQDVHL
jgi:tetratricopeptide (TPR) repeat protein